MATVAKLHLPIPGSHNPQQTYGSDKRFLFYQVLFLNTFTAQVKPDNFEKAICLSPFWLFGHCHVLWAKS